VVYLAYGIAIVLTALLIVVAAFSERRRLRMRPAYDEEARS
jgi:hypothetical protein